MNLRVDACRAGGRTGGVGHRCFAARIRQRRSGAEDPAPGSNRPIDGYVAERLAELIDNENLERQSKDGIHGRRLQVAVGFAHRRWVVVLRRESASANECRHGSKHDCSNRDGTVE